MKVSLIATVRNEEASVRALLGSLARQTRLPDEVVIVDGGSTDRTVALLREEAASLPGLRVIEQPGANIAQGRNAAISAAEGDVIAATDAGVELDPRWLAEILRPIEEDGADVSGGFFRPAARSDRPALELAIAAAMVPLREEIAAETFLPSSRSVAFRKTAWQSAGGYPEWLPICEDVVFDLSARRRGARFAFAPDAIALWDTPRALGRYMRQLFRYTRGDGHARLWFGRQVTRYATYLGAVVLLVAGKHQLPLAVMVIALFGLLYMSRFFRRAWMHFPDVKPVKRVAVLAAIPVVCFLGDVAKMAGWPVGLAQRVLGRIPPR